MKRILVSQNERNNGSDYLIVNGELLNDDDEIVYYGRVFSKTDDWKEIHKDDFFEIRCDGNKILLKSFYIDKDVAGRFIYFMYLVEEFDDYNTVLNSLYEDSQIISRSFDRERIEEIIKKIKQEERIKKKMKKGVLYAILSLGLIFAYLLIKNKL